MKSITKIIILAILFEVFSINAQENIHISKKDFKQAEYAFERSDYLTAFTIYSSILSTDSLNYDIIYKSGICLFNINKSDIKAINYFLKSMPKIPESYFYLGRIYQLHGEIKKAIEAFYYFKSINNEENISNAEVNGFLKNCENALLEEARKENYIVSNIGSQINSKYPDYVPLFWTINNSLIFTSRRESSKGGNKDPYGRFYEDIYIAQSSGNNWENPTPFGDEINTQTHDACVAFSNDGKELIIYRTDEKQTGGDLYICKYDGTNWSVPEKLGPEINSEYLEASACFSADGDEIIFSSNRPGGLGGKDLYRVRKFINGKYSLPFNLGPSVNTPFDEDAPFIDKRDNSLYFSSKGHNTIGEYDIFRSEYDCENYKWIKAKNLGIPINSTNDDIYFIKLEDKNVAYFSSRREGGFGDADIYQINFDESTQIIVFCKLNISGLVKEDLKDFQLTVYDIDSGKLQGIYRPNKSNMTLILLVGSNKPYKILLESTHTEPIIKYVSFNEKNKELTLDVVKKQ